MFKLVILSVMLPLLVTSLLFSKYIFYNALFNNDRQDPNKHPLVNYAIGYAGLALLFVTHEYFLASVSFNSLGFVAYDYVLGLTVYFWMEKRYGGTLIMATPIVIGSYMVLGHHAAILNIFSSIIFAAVVLILAALVGSERRKHRFIAFIILLSIVSLATPFMNSFIYNEPFRDRFDLVCLLIGSLFVCANLWLFDKQKSKSNLELAVLKKHEQYDTLTGLRSFFSFNQLMDDQTIDPSHPQTFIMLDIDHFKDINDEYGHLEGNKVLTFFANRLKQYFIDQKTLDYKIYRFGGEEFCVMIDGSVPEETFQIISSFQKQLRKERFVAADGRKIRVSFSGGVSSTRDFQGNATDAVRHADEALYSAKKKGRSQIACYKPQDSLRKPYGSVAE